MLTTGPTVKPFDCVPPAGGTTEAAMLTVRELMQTIPAKAPRVDELVDIEVRMPAVADVYKITPPAVTNIAFEEPPDVVAGTF